MQPIPRVCAPILALIFVASTALADLPPPDLPKAYFSSEPPTSHNLLSAGIHLGSFHVVFEETTLATVLQTIGQGAISHQGDASESIYYLCYTLADTHTHGRVWIIASGEMGGSEHRVDVVNARTDESAVPMTECPALPSKFEQLSFDGNIFLGMQDVAAINSLGSIYKKQKDWIHYNYIGQILGACSPDAADLINYISFERSGGILKWIVGDKQPPVKNLSLGVATMFALSQKQTSSA